jgi:integrase
MPNGTHRIQFLNANIGKRCAIYLTDFRLADAEVVKTRIEGILSAGYARQEMPAELARWLGDIPDTLYSKLENVGLVSARRSGGNAAVLLGDFVKRYIAERSGVDVKVATGDTYTHVQRNLVDYFTARKLMSAITPGDADGFRRHLISAKCYRKGGRRKAGAPAEVSTRSLSLNTVNKRCSIAKQIFEAAVRSRVIRENPFSGIKCATVKADRKRDHFISLEDARAISDACPDAQWRLIFALSRFGGMRCPSEHLALTWDCIDWEKKRITVLSPKTERHPGRDQRMLPMFPELEAALSEVWENAPEGTKHVITRYRARRTNLRTQFLKIIRRAGLKPWPVLFHNLRKTRQTELSAEYPVHVVCEWLGNSQIVAKEFYLRVTDADIAKAVSKPTGNESRDAYTTHEPGNSDQFCTTLETPISKKARRITDSRGIREDVNSPFWTRTIDEKQPENSSLDGSATHLRRKLTADADLARLIEAWPTLTADVRQHIVELATMPDSVLA